ncbi:amino acid adenylation domain-containing protein [Catenulispora sp. GAS73]|uniref:non-ribosomal peptide synthetase n=1 Tax=Catenulispora sp. GAS73 TaxID=3156269 RepID=UPI0035156076
MPGGSSREEKRTVPWLFEAVAARAADRPAVLYEGRSVCYAELNARANRLARALIDRGVGPDRVVAVSAPKSDELIVVLLAVLKAGGAYLALDPAYPAERLAHMVRQARPLLLIHLGGQAEPVLPAETALPRIDVLDPGFRAECAARPGHDVTDAERRRPLRPEHLMYVVFTSGSTGRPKGVAVPHSGVAALAAGQREHLGAGPGDRVLQWASISFDAAFWDITLALLSGAALVMAAAEDLLPGAPLRETMIANAVTHATLPPVALSVTDAHGVLPGGKLVSTGDAVSPALVRTWSEGRSLFNGYGPTEVTVGSSMGRVTEPEDISIGRPFPDNVVRVLDERLRAVAAGGEGEMYLAGPGLARGYLNHPGLTATRFVADPAGPAGGRIYRSGDRGRRRADGELYFTGRADSQVKLRGFRVELGEIETRLAAHPSVELACVVVEGDVASARIAGYVTASAGAAGAGGVGGVGGIGGEELREFAARSLPDHMVPYRVTVVDRFPTDPNGKIDRAAVSAAHAERSAPPAAVSDPVDLDTDTDLYSIVRRVLGIPEARPEDNFFLLGGHSVLATMLARQIRKEFDVVIPMRSIFEAATLADLAAEVDAARQPDRS